MIYCEDAIVKANGATKQNREPQITHPDKVM
jgi:hypothetical protein